MHEKRDAVARVFIPESIASSLRSPSVHKCCIDDREIKRERERERVCKVDLKEFTLVPFARFSLGSIPTKVVSRTDISYFLWLQLFRKYREAGLR